MSDPSSPPPTSLPPAPAGKSAASKRPNTKVLGLVTIAILAGGFGWSFTQYQRAQDEVARLSSEINEQGNSVAETEQLVEQVRQHLVLPEDEQPTVATVSDADALRETQPFFEHAQNGDRVLIYVNNRRSILYSPERDIVVNVGALVVNDQEEVDEGGTANSQVAGEQDRN